jgi:hypothetical protein
MSFIASGSGKVRVNLQHHVVLVQLGKDNRNLPLAEGVIERIVDGLGKELPAATRYRGRCHELA